MGRYWSWDFPIDLDFRLAKNPVFWLVAAEIEVFFSFPWDNCTLFYLLLAVAGAGFPRAGGLFGNGSGIVLLFLLAEHATGVPVAGMLRVSAGGGVVAAAGGCLAWGAVLRVKKRQRVRESFWVWRAAVPVGLRQTACWVRL